MTEINSTGKRIVEELCNNNVENAKVQSIARYFSDMQRVAEKTYSILSDCGMAIFVIGNTEYKGVRVENARHLAEALFDAGYTTINVVKRKISNKILTPYRDAIGRFTTDASGRKIYNDEFIVIGRKKK